MLENLEKNSSIFDNINHEINQIALNMNNNFTKHQEIVAKMKEHWFYVCNQLFCDDGSEQLAKFKEKCKELTHYIQDLSETEIQLITKKQIVLDQLTEDEDCISNLTESVKQLTIEEQKLKNEKENFQKDLIKKHEALKLSVFYYKSALNIHVALENHNETSFLITISFFTKSENKGKYSVQILYNEEDDTWELADMCPKVTVYNALAERLHTTQDIIGFFVAVRSIFKKIRDKSCN